MAVQACEQSIFLHAIGLPSPAERAAYLDEFCRDNPGLRAEVDALLAAHDRLGGGLPPTGLERAGVEPAGAFSAQSEASALTRSTEAVGMVLAGRYKLLEQIGEGGMGTVWMAQQTEPVKRVVAVKLIKTGMDSKQVVTRFEAERQALALMDHPNIAKVHDAGTTGSEPDALARDSAATLAHASGSVGRPFFVMELVKGVPITNYCDLHRLTPRQRLELFVPVCQAIQHAHHKGIIHRDLKPSNVLVALYDDRPVPKVIDFGVAKATGQQLTEQTLHTGLGAVVGTVEYMSPEQAGFNQLDVDTRSDIYSLGVLLYELLTGSPPFTRKELEKAGVLEMLRLIREQEPTKPSTKLSTADGLPTLAANRGTEPKRLTALVRGELDWIVMKALEKDRSRRYETANGFAMDVQRYLNDEHVLACPPSAGYRLRKFVRRNKRALATIGVVVLALLFAVGAFGWAVRDREARHEEAAKQEAARQAKLEEEISRALKEAEDSCQRDKLAEAMAAVKQAEGLLASGGGSEELEQHVRRWRMDLDMVARLEEIRLEQAAVKDGAFDMRNADPAYRKAFRQYDLDLDLLSPDEAAARVRVSAIKDRLVAALDEWLRWKSGATKPLEDVLRRADPDPWRSRFREALQRGDGKALTELARDPELLFQPPVTLNFLASLLSRGRGDVALLGIEVMRKAQRKYPGDFWINHNLAWDLMQLKPPQEGEAVGFYRVALALRPESPGAHLNLGQALYQQDKLDDAISEFRKAIQLKPDYAMAHHNLANALARQGKLDEAMPEFRKAYPQGQDGLGKTLQDQKIAIFRKAIESNPKNADLYTSLGIALRQQGKLEEAITAYRKAIQLEPNESHNYYFLGIALRHLGKLDEAVAAYRQAIELKPHHAAYSNLGIALKKQGKLEEAIVSFRIAIALKPDSAEAYVNLGNAYDGKKLEDDAIAAYRKAIGLKPDLANAHYNLGLALRAKGLPDEAMSAYREAIRLEPDFAEAHVNLGNVLREKGRLDEAIAAYRKAIKLKPDLPNAHYTLGLALQAKGLPDQAMSAYREAIRLKPDYAEAHFNLGLALQAKGQRDQAMTAYREAIRLEPDFAEAHVNLGNVLSDKGRLDKAMTAYREAIRLKPDLADAHGNLGHVLREKGRLDEAIAAYQEAIRLRPAFAEAHHGLGSALRSKGKPDEAIAAYNEAIRLKPNPPGAYLSLGALLCDDKRDYDAAIAAFREAIRLSPDDPNARRNLAIALSHKRDYDGAIAAYKEAIRLKPAAPEYVSLGALLWNHKRDYDGAIAAFREAIRLSPDDPNAHRNLGIVLSCKGKHDQAIAAYKEAIRLSPGDANTHIKLAWLLATCSEVKFRNPAQAVELAQKGVKLAPKNGFAWNTLGVAHYRVSDWKATVEALKKSMELRKGGDGFDRFFLAMAHRQLGNKDEARKWYKQAVQWMDKNDPRNKLLSDDLRRLRREAAELMEIEDGAKPK